MHFTQQAGEPGATVSFRLLAADLLLGFLRRLLWCLLFMRRRPPAVAAAPFAAPRLAVALSAGSRFPLLLLLRLLLTRGLLLLWLLRLLLARAFPLLLRAFCWPRLAAAGPWFPEELPASLRRGRGRALHLLRLIVLLHYGLMRLITVVLTLNHVLLLRARILVPRILPLVDR